MHCGSTKPTKIGVVTPVFGNAEWVLFDSELWECHLLEMYWIQPDAIGKIFVVHPRQRRIYDKTAVSYQGRKTESLDTAMAAAWRESQLKKLGGECGKGVQEKIGSTSTSMDTPKTLGVASGGIGKHTKRNESTEAYVLERIRGDTSKLEILASKP